MEPITSMSDPLFQSIWTRFNSNIGSLWIFSKNISAYADKEDSEQLSQIAFRLSQLFDDDPINIEMELRQYIDIADEIELEPNFFENPEIKEVVDAFKMGEFGLNVQRWIRRFPNKRNQMSDLLVSIFEPTTANGVILRRGTFILLVSFFETLLIDLLQLRYGLRTEKIDISSIGTFKPNKAVERIINQGSFTQRTELICSSGVNTNFIENHNAQINEVIQRRNLFTHKDGIIDQSYIDHIHGENPSLIIGRRLRISEKYLLSSIETVYLYSYLLYQQCWRSWTSEKHKQADLHYVNVLYMLLRKNRNHLVIQLATQERNFNIARKERQTILINQAIAFRELNMKEEAIELIKSEIQHPANQTINLALHILKGEYESAFILLVRMAKNGKMKEITSDWPLFKPVLSDQRFYRILNRVR